MDSKILGLVEFPYYFTSLPATIHQSLGELARWADESEMTMYYTGGYVYFENEEDKLIFILK